MLCDLVAEVAAASEIGDKSRRTVIRSQMKTKEDLVDELANHEAIDNIFDFDTNYVFIPAVAL